MKIINIKIALLFFIAGSNAFADWSCPIENQGIPFGSVIVSQQSGNKGIISASTLDQGSCPSIKSPNGSTCFRILLTHKAGIDTCAIEGWKGPNEAFIGSNQKVVCPSGRRLVPDALPSNADKCVVNTNQVNPTPFSIYLSCPSDHPIVSFDSVSKRLKCTIGPRKLESNSDIQ